MVFWNKCEISWAVKLYIKGLVICSDILSYFEIYSINRYV